MMASLHFLSVDETFLDYLLQKATPQEILAFKASEEAQEYVSELIERNSAGTLTAAEVIELQQILEFERKMSVLKAKALADLNRS